MSERQGVAPLFVMTGCVEHGDARGRQIGFPTANLAIRGGDVEDGVFAGLLFEPGGVHAAAISVGRRATVYGETGVRLLEANVLDFSGDLYGVHVTVCMWRHLRGQQRFDSLGALSAQLALDVEATRRWYRSECTVDASTLAAIDVGVLVPNRAVAP